MSEGPAKSTRRQFTLATILVVVAGICLDLAGLRLLSDDERIGLLIVMAILAFGYSTFRITAWLYRTVKSTRVGHQPIPENPISN